MAAGPGGEARLAVFCWSCMLALADVRVALRVSSAESHALACLPLASGNVEASLVMAAKASHWPARAEHAPSMAAMLC